jgi:hypothetical protein
MARFRPLLSGKLPNALSRPQTIVIALPKRAMTVEIEKSSLFFRQSK